MKDSGIIEEAERPLSMNSNMFMLWLFIGSIAMLFVAFTSAYIVRVADAPPINVLMPFSFWLSSGVILLSSLTVIMALRAAKQDAFSQVRLWMWISFILGIAFLYLQIKGWGELVLAGHPFAGKINWHPAGSFYYILSGLHGLHLVSAVIWLVVVVVKSEQKKIHSKMLNNIQMFTTYWHFLDLLWIYLFVFLLVNNSIA